MKAPAARTRTSRATPATRTAGRRTECLDAECLSTVRPAVDGFSGGAVGEAETGY